ncbi:MAG TPA: hypothetical protein VFF69_10590 [Phycisphaerales bacterium]|nr:hypothetical protein [Phycisphaerales bacterium]
MPKLRLFHDVDPLESDAIPFPRTRRDEEGFQLRLADDSIETVEAALQNVQTRLDEVRRLVARGWCDDDGPRAA